MIKLLARIGRFYTVSIITIIAALISIGVTAVAAALLNYTGTSVNLAIAIAFAACVPLLVTPLLGWYLIGLLLRIYQVEEEMRSLASYDSLTGLLSRHAFFDRANNHLSLANRDRSVFSVLLVDLDLFKAINDQYGHPAGDAVLKLFADVANSVIRRSDFIGRLGGEEFALILPSTTTAEALEFSGRLHDAINKAVLKYKDSIIQYTASIGLTSFDPAAGDSIDSLLARADIALYQAKRAGRNQSAVFKHEDEQAAAG